MITLLFIGGCLIVSLGILIVVWKVSRKEVTTREDARSCNVVHMYKNDDDPERTVTDEYDYPVWRKTQQN